MRALAVTISLFTAVPALAGSWLQGGNGYLGPDPVFSGKVEGWNLYVCAAATEKGFQAGHIANGQGACFVSWGTSSIGFPYYFVLNGSHDFIWVDRNIVDRNKVVYLDLQDSTPTGICRVNGVHNGKMLGTPNNGNCVTAWGNGNQYHTTFEVLQYR